MKKIVSLMLILTLLCCSSAALAAGKLQVTQENYHYVKSYSDYVYAYSKVENVGDRPIKVNAGVFEVYDANGDVLTSTDYMKAYATYLQPGEYTYVKMSVEIEEGQTPDDQMLTLTGKSDSSTSALHLPVETKLELGVQSGWRTYNYMYATVTNNTDDIVYDVAVVLALLDAEGNILYIENQYTYLGINPGSTVTIREDISSAFMDYFEANDYAPAKVDALAYVIISND